MRLLVVPVLFVVLLGQSSTPAGGWPVPAPARSGDHPPAGVPAKKPVKYVPLPVAGMPGTGKTIPYTGEGIPVYYSTPEGLARAKEVGPVFLGPEFATRYAGRVVGLTEKSVTIKPEGHRQTNEISFHPDTSVKEERVYLQDNTEPPRTFVFNEHLRYWSGLRAAPPSGGLSPYHGHKIGDLQIGDAIDITCQRLSGLDCCGDIQIRRRPGGRVPPMMGEDHLPPKMPRWHDSMNAEQAREEAAFAVVQRIGMRLLR